MTFLIRESSRRSGQEYSISIYSDASVRHSPIYRDGSDLMLMSLTFTSLVELVNYFSRKPIFQKLTLGQPAIRYNEFIEKQRDYQSQGLSKSVIFFRTLPNEIELQIGTLRASEFVRSLFVEEYSFVSSSCRGRQRRSVGRNALVYLWRRQIDTCQWLSVKIRHDERLGNLLYENLSIIRNKITTSTSTWK